MSRGDIPHRDQKEAQGAALSGSACRCNEWRSSVVIMAAFLKLDVGARPIELPAWTTGFPAIKRER